MAILLAQALCGPARQCLLAAAGEYDAPNELERHLRLQVEALLARGAINPWCGLCGAKAQTWLYEVGRTPYRTMAEAEPALRQAEAAQAQTAARLKAAGLAYDPPA